MSDVTLVTYCCEKDVRKLYAPGKLQSLVASHQYPFEEVILVRQLCQDVDMGEPEIPCRVLLAEDYPDIRSEFGIEEDNPEADRHTKETRYYWRYHCWNQLVGLREAKTVFIVFADCDTEVSGAPWIGRGIEILNGQPDIFMVSPTTGTPEGKTGAISQIIFLCRRKQFLFLDYEAPIPRGESPGSFHFVFEGRLHRYAVAAGKLRYIMGDTRVVHYAW